MSQQTTESFEPTETTFMKLCKPYKFVPFRLFCMNKPTATTPPIVQKTNSNQRGLLINMKNLKTVENFNGFPTISSNRLLLDHGGKNHMYAVKNRTKRPAEKEANNILEHVKLGSNITAILKGKLSLGAKIIQNGGVGKIFKQKFNVGNGEKILKASQCYISTTVGPIAGLLFITTHRIAFYSERSIKLKSSSGMSARAHYKVSIPLGKIKGTILSQNDKGPSQKYIKLATVDNFDFWFMGFLNYQNTYKCIIQAISLPQYFQLTEK